MSPLWYGVHNLAWFEHRDKGLTDDQFAKEIKSFGANLVFQNALSKSSVSGLSGFVNACKANGLAVWLYVTGVDAWGFDAVHESRVKVILDYPAGFQNSFINNLKVQVAGLDLDAIALLNEPMDYNGYLNYSWFDPYKGMTNESDFFNRYKSYLVKCLNALRTVKPSIVGGVDPMPFYDSRMMANNPPSLTNVLYTVHSYYNGGQKDTCDPPTRADLLNYWNGNFATAKSQLWSRYDSTRVGPLIAKGLPVNVTELGINGWCWNAYGNTRGHLSFLKDSWDYCKSKGIGYGMHALMSLGPTGTHSGMYAILTDDWKTLNGVGQLWSQNLPLAKLKVSYSSTPIPVSATINDQTVPSPSTVEVSSGSTLNIIVPAQVSE